MIYKPKKANVNKSTDMIDYDYVFNVKAMDDYLSKMRSGRKTEANKGAVIYDDVSDKIKDNKYASTMINIGKSFSDFGKYNHLNDLYYINNPSGLDDGYKYINKEDMNKYFYLLASHEKGDVDKKDVDDLKHYLFNIGTKINAKEADELPPIENKPDYSKISSEEQLIYDSFGNVVNKAKGIDYSGIPTDDQFTYIDDGFVKKAVDKAKNIDYNKVYDSFGFEVNTDYDKNMKTLSNIGKDIKESADWAEYGEFPDFNNLNPSNDNNVDNNCNSNNNDGSNNNGSNNTGNNSGSYDNGSNNYVYGPPEKNSIGLDLADKVTNVLSYLGLSKHPELAQIGSVSSYANGAIKMFKVTRLDIKVKSMQEFYTMAFVNMGAQMYNNNSKSKYRHELRSDMINFIPLTKADQEELIGKTDDEIKEIYNKRLNNNYDVYEFMIYTYNDQAIDENNNKQTTKDLTGIYYDEMTDVQKKYVLNCLKLNHGYYQKYMIEPIDDFVTNEMIGIQFN